jgi:hypothetical protein
MKHARTTTTLAILLLILASGVFAQSARDLMQKALRDELKRNADRLSLENLKKPCYISYRLGDIRMLNVSASLGALITSNQRPMRPHGVRVMVGEYARNDENFFDINSGYGRNTMLEGADQVGIENDYNAIRRGLWIATDNIYKSAAETFERKLASIEQQKLSPEEAALPDFTKGQKTVLSVPFTPFDFQQEKWEAATRELSALFRALPEIQSSGVNVVFLQGDAYFTDTEGSENVVPMTIATVSIFASCQAADGDPLKDNLQYVGLAPEDLPSLQTMKNEVTEMATRLVALRNAPAITDAYTGPVLFEGQAVGEMFLQRFFSGSSGLIALRKPILSDPRMAMYMSQAMKSAFEDKIGTRILPAQISIIASPGLKTSGKTKLIGSFDVDAEGVKPPKDLTLVDKGMLKTLLCDRTPTLKVRESNGHSRPVFNTYQASSATGPGVIVVNADGGKTAAELRKDLLKRAKDEGLTHAFIVRKLFTQSGDDLDLESLYAGMSGMGQEKEEPGSKLSHPVLLYRVDVNTGVEELVRSAQVSGLGTSALRRLAGTEKKQFVYNTLAPGSGGGMFSMTIGYGPFQSIAASFIVPNSVLFEELEVKKEQRAYTPKVPVVPSPLVKE